MTMDPIIRDDCPNCGHAPLDYVRLMTGFTEATRSYWCEKCDWCLTVNMPAPETERKHA